MTREDLEIVKIEDICQKIVSGGTPSTKNQNFYINGTVPWLKTQEVDFNRIYDTQTYITENALSSSSAKIIPVNSVIIAMYGATAGKIAINKIELSTNQACCNLIINKEKANYNYVFYKLRTMFETIVSMAFGGAQQNLSVGTIKNIKISLPPLAEQQRIASILSAYDDLIENNTRRIVLLEQMAQTLYRQWFVNFKFPGYKDVEMVESGTDFGMIPSGWEVKNLYDIAYIQMGFAFSSNQFNNKGIGIPAIRIRDILNNYTSTYTDQFAGNGYIVNSGDILVGMDGNFYLSVWAGKDGYLVQRVCKIKGKDDINNGYLLQALKKPIQFLESTITGTTVAHLSASDLRKIYLLIPRDKSLLDQFDLFTKKSIQYEKQNQSLKDQRDLLLRKLIG